MTDAVSPSPPASLPCKICKAEAPFFDRADFHANAKMHFGYYDLPINPSGMMLDYHRCKSCGFMFTPFMDKWGDEQFRGYVYNKDYAQIDGTFNGFRSGLFANLFTLALHDYLGQLDLLDYGGGIGLQAIMLKAFGARNSQTYDPHAAQKVRPSGAFHLVTCIEVLEHSPDPAALIADLVSFMNTDSSLLFITTELQPEDIDKQKCNWWYVNPRVGHISFFTKPALQKLMAPYGFKLAHVGTQAHVAYREWPVWAERLLPPGAREG
jgi:2-polyprenyl-6-hydroxyphenyl methylase/3-demethylubiquinone-9 3-methyltransferase